MTALGAATHRGDPLALLDIEPALQRLREASQDPNWIKGLARRLLLDNPHRVTLVLTPDAELAQRREQAEARRLARIKAGLSDAEHRAIIDQAQALLQRQASQDDLSLLPRVGLEDIKPDIQYIEGQPHAGPLPTTRYARGTNGLVYQQVLLQLPRLEDRKSRLNSSHVAISYAVFCLKKKKEPH